VALSQAFVDLRCDVRHSVRPLIRQPGYTLTILTTLALAIGANTAIFSLVRAVVLRPLTYKEPDRLVHIYENHPKRTRFAWGSDANYIIVRPGTLYEWRRQSTSFESIEAVRWRTKTLTGNPAESVWANEVTEGFFTTAGVAAMVGRTLLADDFSPGVSRAVVLSDRLWRSRYGADPNIVRRSIQIDGSSIPVVGVMPPEFSPSRYQTADLWLPYLLETGSHSDRVTWSFTTYARLKPGVTFEQAHREMDLISDRLEASYPQDYANMGAVLVPVTAEVIGSYGRLLSALLSAVALVLLIGCVNVANLTLARSMDRAGEFAIRAALGAPRDRVIRQVLTESVVLSLGGGLIGVVVARVALPAAVALLPAENAVPRINGVQIDWAVLLFTLILSIAAGVLFGIVPACRVSQSTLSESLKETGRAPSANRRTKAVGDLLAAGEIALSLVLLAAAGLLLRSFARLQAVDSGFDTPHVLAVQLTVPNHRYGTYVNGGPNQPRARLYRTLAREARAVAGVDAVAMTGLLPLNHGPNPWSISIEGRGAPAEPEPGGAASSSRPGLFHHGSVSIERVTPGYFDALGVRLVHGRLLDDRDRDGATLVTVVNETFVRKFFSGEDPIGRRITADMTNYFPTLTIVGVVADNKMHGLDRPPYPLLYWPMDQFPSANAWLVVRSAARPETLARALRSTIERVDGDLAVTDVESLETVASNSIWRQRFAMLLLGVFAGLALLLAAAGIYAVVSYSVTQRTRELGLRIALGALPRQILWLVIARGIRLAAAGVVVGAAASLSLRRLLAAQLFGVSASDPLTISVVSGVMVLVAVAACAVPAARALRIDPIAALKSE